MYLKYPTRTDLLTAMNNPAISFRAEELIGGKIVKKGSRVIQYSGGYSTVFPFFTKEGKKVAVRLWIADIGEAKKRSLEISQYLEGLKNDYFAQFRYIDDAILVNGTLHPVVIMEWIQGQTLKDYLQEIISYPEKVLRLASRFRVMVTYFHKQKIAHGDLQHGNILVTEEGEIVVIDYDSMFISPLAGMPDIIKGLEGYQHPSRRSNQVLHSKLDYFSELVIYLSLLVFADDSGLWSKYIGTEDLLFSKEDLQSPNNSTLIESLLSSEDEMIARLTEKLILELQKDDIRDLLPLEELLLDKLEVAKSNIFEKWDLQRKPPFKPTVHLPDKENIIDKF